MIRLPPRSTRTDTLFPYTTLFRSRVMPTLRPTSPSRWAAGVGVEFDIVFSIPDCDWSGLITVHLKHKRHKRIALVFCLYRRAHEFLKTKTFLVKRSTLTCRTHTSQAVSEYLPLRSEEQTSELQSLMRISYAVFCLKKTKK